VTAAVRELERAGAVHQQGLMRAVTELAPEWRQHPTSWGHRLRDADWSRRPHTKGAHPNNAPAQMGLVAKYRISLSGLPGFLVQRLFVAVPRPRWRTAWLFGVKLYPIFI
jgi:hypothetical protein